MGRIDQIKKRDGRIVEFNEAKIADAIWKAAQAAGVKDRSLAVQLAEQVRTRLSEHLQPDEIPHVEQVQDLVERTLIEQGQASMAKAYILYREKRSRIRKTKSLLGVEDQLKLPLNSLLVLERRYLQKDPDGRVIESTSDLFRRVAKTVAAVEQRYGKSDADVAT